MSMHNFLIVCNAQGPSAACGVAGDFRKRPKDHPASQIRAALFGMEPSADIGRLNNSRGSDMERAWTLSTCFEHFGAARCRRHFGGSAISHDGETVVVAMWEDEIVRLDSRATYQFGPTLKGKSQRVSLQWITHLRWAIAHCDGRVRVVVLTAENTQANPRVIRSCYPDDALTMQITHFDSKTGFIQACTVSPGASSRR